MTTSEDHNTVEKNVEDENLDTAQDKQIKRKVYWAAADTKAVVSLFHEALLNAIAGKHAMLQKRSL